MSVQGKSIDGGYGSGNSLGFRLTTNLMMATVLLIAGLLVDSDAAGAYKSFHCRQPGHTHVAARNDEVAIYRTINDGDYSVYIACGLKSGKRATVYDGVGVGGELSELKLDRIRLSGHLVTTTRTQGSFETPDDTCDQQTWRYNLKAGGIREAKRKRVKCGSAPSHKHRPPVS